MRKRIYQMCAALAMAVLPVAGQNSLIVHTAQGSFPYALGSIDRLTLGADGFTVNAAQAYDFTYDNATSLTFKQSVAGDLNGDDKVDVADVNIVINIILGQNPDPSTKALADLTGDEKVDVSDVNEIINIILKTGTTHVSQDGRMLVHRNTGDIDAMPTSDVASITFVTIAEARATITLIDADEASVRARITRSEGCKRYQVACYPASESIGDDGIEAYIQENKKYDRKVNGSVEFIDLMPETDYVMATLAYDEYDLPCEITTLNFTTDAIGELPAAQVGDYLYTDGSWSSELKTNKTAVGIIFSTTPTDTDQARGYTHGYAMAVNDAGIAAWSTQGSESESGATIDNTNDADILDREGLTHTGTLLTTPDIHPAAVMAQTFATAPHGTSGWFLPSTGQWLDICAGLGGLDITTFTRTDSGIATWSAEAAAACINAINSRLAALGSGKYTALNQSYYWTSSERSVASAYYIFMNPQYYLSLQTYYKDNQFTVRPVIAF